MMSWKHYKQIRERKTHRRVRNTLRYVENAQEINTPEMGLRRLAQLAERLNHHDHPTRETQVARAERLGQLLLNKIDQVNTDDYIAVGLAFPKLQEAWQAQPEKFSQEDAPKIHQAFLADRLALGKRTLG